MLLPVRIEPYPPSEAETMRRWGADPELGPNLVAGLSRSHRVISADYEGHRMAHPAPDTLTPANLAADLLAIADAAGADTFAYYGYSSALPPSRSRGRKANSVLHLPTRKSSQVP